MCAESIYLAGRYNKYLRDLSQSPWIDKDDVRIKNSVQELIEEGLNEFLKFEKSVFSSSGREDVDVRMLGQGRPFVFKLVNPFNPSTYNEESMRKIENYINTKHLRKIHVRDLQIVEKQGVLKHIKEGQESKTKEYRALCCCTRKLTAEDVEKISKIKDLEIDQQTPIRVLHRRTQAVRRRKILRMEISEVKLGEFDSLLEENLDQVFAITLLTEAGTYIKEFVHGDFGRTVPSLADILGSCETDLMELDVLEVYSDWPPKTTRDSTNQNSTDLPTENMDKSEKSLSELYEQALKLMREAEKKPRGDARQDLYLKARCMFQKASELVESLNLFSDNETIDDVATVDLKYLLIDAYLANIIVSLECHSDRLNHFLKVRQMIEKFFTRIVKYNLSNGVIENALKSDEITTGIGGHDLQSAMQARTDKIEKYKKMKMLEDRLDELDRRVNSGNELDDEIIREYYLNLLKKWIENTLECLEREVKPAVYFERNRSTGSLDGFPSTSKPVAIKPVTIVKDQLQKQVFGLGYPSKPTVTVDEFIDKKFKDGDLAFQTQKEVYANSLQRYAEKPNLLREQEELSDAEHEEKEERDDSDELKRKRNWDEFKDDNPRGSGNRYNMG